MTVDLSHNEQLHTQQVDRSKQGTRCNEEELFTGRNIASFSGVFIVTELAVRSHAQKETKDDLSVKPNQSSDIVMRRLKNTKKDALKVIINSMCQI